MDMPITGGGAPGAPAPTVPRIIPVSTSLVPPYKAEAEELASIHRKPPI
jgi:hypothetical protein